MTSRRRALRIMSLYLWGMLTLAFVAYTLLLIWLVAWAARRHLGAYVESTTAPTVAYERRLIRTRTVAVQSMVTYTALRGVCCPRFLPLPQESHGATVHAHYD